MKQLHPTPLSQLHLWLVLWVLLGGTVLATGCQPSIPKKGGFDLREAVLEGHFSVGVEPEAGLAFDHSPRAAVGAADHERRPVVLLPPGRWSWQGRVPSHGWLQAGAALSGPLEGAGLEVVASVTAGKETEVVAVARSEERRWLDVGADLRRYAGRRVKVELQARVLPAKGRAVAPETLVAWSAAGVWGAPPSPIPETPPNILMIVVDTLRADHLSSYGYHRATSPEIDRLLAARGVVLEDAYSQAPWTLPSVISMLTGVYPGEILARNIGAYRFPEALPTLAELLREQGYETAAFNANPALHRGMGFDRGFTTFFSPPADFAWFQRHAEDLNRRAIPWLQAHQGEPFFLYLQYLDPHDPYENPDLVHGRSPFYPDYAGNLNGTHIHGVYAGAHELENPEADVAHLTALYDSEIHYVDRYIGRLLETVRSEVLANTLVLLTSDHGEELYDHGGWKHGQSVYQEQIHVPLILRWDGVLPAGKRISGEVQLLDLMPTLLAAAGGEPEGHWQGQNLLPAVRGDSPLPRRPAFAEDLSFGPRRAAVILGGQKLMTFDRQTPFAPVDSVQAYLWRKDLERLRAVEWYSLVEDPGETTDLLRGEGGKPEKAEVDRLASVIHRRYQQQDGGLWVAASGIPEGERLAVRLRVRPAPVEVRSFFLAEDDLVELEGEAVRLEIVGAPKTALPLRGALLPHPQGRSWSLDDVVAVELSLDGAPLPPEAVRRESGGEWRIPYLRGEGVSDGEGPRLHLWVSSGPTLDLQREEDPETRKRLQALGYLGS